MLLKNKLHKPPSRIEVVVDKAKSSCKTDISLIKKDMNIELLREDFCHYATYMKGSRKATIRRYRQNIKTFSRNLDVSDLSEVNEKNVRIFFMKGRTERNWKPATYRTYYMTLKVFFRWCMKQGYIKKNYIEDLELPNMDEALPKGLSKKEAMFLLEVAYNLPYVQKYQRYRNHAIYATFLYTGIRKSELLNLKLTDVDIENRSLFIHKGKGGKDRILPLHSKLVQSLDRYLRERKKAKKMTPYFFTSSNRDMGFTEEGLKWINNKIKKVSKISFTTHGLRHTFGTLMSEAGCDIYSLSKMMGHSNIKTTMIYVHTNAEHLREEMTKHPLDMMMSI